MSIALPESAVNTVLDAIITNLKNNPTLIALFGDITRAEFPLGRDLPICNVNASGTTDAVGVLGEFTAGRKQRAVRVQVYITLDRSQTETMDPDLWQLVDAVRAVIEADRTLGGVLDLPVIEVNARSVPSPIGTAYLGTRVLEFDAYIRENLL